MNKILLTYDGRHFSESVFEWARFIHSHHPIMATAVFLPEIDYIELLYSYGGVMTGPTFETDSLPVGDTTLQSHIEKFIGLCKEHKIYHKVHTDFTKHVGAEVREESRFADLMVMCSETYYENMGADTQQDYINDTLRKANCPVLAVPGKFSAPRSVILAYDGSDQSVYAIKQFAYLFPWMLDAPAVLVNFSDAKDVPEHNLIDELLNAHFSAAAIMHFAPTSQKEMENWMLANNSPILVTGAYGRSMLSEAIKKSFISQILIDHKLPVFVAHK
jgi:hypothetical protein